MRRRAGPGFGRVLELARRASWRSGPRRHAGPKAVAAATAGAGWHVSDPVSVLYRGRRYPARVEYASQEGDLRVRYSSNWGGGTELIKGADVPARLLQFSWKGNAGGVQSVPPPPPPPSGEE